MMSASQLFSTSIARIVHRSSSKRKALIMATAYLDESGIHRQSSVVVIAGYFAVLEEWERFEVQWNDVLRLAGISTFHATDCLGGYDDFKSMPHAERQDLYKMMIQVINTHQIIGTSSGILWRDYEAVMADVPKPMFFKPYVLCFQHALFDLYDCFVKAYPDVNEELAVVCGLQRDFGHEALELFRKVKEYAKAGWKYFDRLNSITFVSENKAPLQAADILAHETYRELLRRTDPNSGRPVRKSFAELCKSGLEGHYFDRQALLALKHQFMSDPDWLIIQGYERS